MANFSIARHDSEKPLFFIAVYILPDYSTAAAARMFLRMAESLLSLHATCICLQAYPLVRFYSGGSLYFQCRLGGDGSLPFYNLVQK